MATTECKTQLPQHKTGPQPVLVCCNAPLSLFSTPDLCALCICVLNKNLSDAGAGGTETPPEPANQPSRASRLQVCLGLYDWLPGNCVGAPRCHVGLLQLCLAAAVRLFHASPVLFHLRIVVAVPWAFAGIHQHLHDAQYRKLAGCECNTGLLEIWCGGAVGCSIPKTTSWYAHMPRWGRTFAGTPKSRTT